MEFPVRCFSCGTVLGHLHEKYKEVIKSKPVEESLDELNVTRYCCRRMFVSHVDIISNVTKYPRI
jgi:DNA-directed RNA polymerase subunit N (RpoN/RPB10)